jgi:hypothetical protein
MRERSTADCFSYAASSRACSWVKHRAGGLRLLQGAAYSCDPTRLVGLGLLLLLLELELPHAGRDVLRVDLVLLLLLDLVRLLAVRAHRSR